jgi:hypothetical protein
MEQMNLDGFNVVELDYENEVYPLPVRDFRPAVYKNGDSFCCLLGPDPQAGIFGCGATVDEAIQEWTRHFRERMAEAGEDDPIATEIRDYKSIDKEDVW